MYTLSVEIHGLRQLERLQPELIADVRRRVIAVLEVHGGSFLAQQGGLWLFRFERAEPEDRQGVLDALSQLTSLLAAREAELSGWSIYLDYVEGTPDEAGRIVHEAMLSVYEDNAVWVGRAAHSLLGELIEMEPSDPERGLYRVTGRTGATADEVGSVPDSARSDRAVDAILDSFLPDELAGGMLLLISDDQVSLRTNARAAIGELIGANPAVRWLEAEAGRASQYGPLISMFTAMDVHETRFWLDEAARASWDERSSLIEQVLACRAGATLPDAWDTDLMIALETYLVAFVRRAAEAVVPPILLCHGIDQWSPAAQDSLARIVGRLPVVDAKPALILVATASRSSVGAGIGSLVRGTVRLPRPGAGDLRAATSGEVNWERMMRLTRGHSAAVAHYLYDSAFWDHLTDRDLEGVGESDLAWRVVAGQVSELQELLLAASYAGSFVSREQYSEIAVSLGTDRVRVPAALSRLRALGLVEDRTGVVPSYPEHQASLERALGRAARTVHEKVAASLVRFADAGAMETTEALLAFLSKSDAGDDLPRLYHRLLTRVMSERRLGEGHRLLYDAVPPRGFSPGLRGCMQAVLSGNRLRLALLQGNMQAARRTRSASDRNADGEACDVASGDLAVQKARLSVQEGSAREAVALLKRAIMIYQDLDDQAGLARANLDFGLVLLSQEDLLDAREYLLLAGRSAAHGDDLFEQIRSRQLMLVCDFVYGNLTRSLAQADELDLLAGRAGMREIQLFAELARGRITFELGRYEQAADVFSRGRSRARLYGFGLPGMVMQRWLARSLVHDERVRRGVSILEDCEVEAESCFFLAEAFLRMGEHARAISVLDRGLAMSTAPAGAVEAVSWTTGYAALEDRAIGATAGTKVLLHQMMALRGYLLAESGRIAEGVEEMHRLTRELRISEIDPYNRIYFYLYSLILPDSGELNVEDRSTVLGKAVRYIQQRTSRMDEYAHKTDFLRRNYWNSRLMAHAQAHNLV